MLAAACAQTGAGEGIRTPDPLITNQMLYRLSYASRTNLIIIAERTSNCKALQNIFYGSFPGTKFLLSRELGASFWRE